MEEIKEIKENQLPDEEPEIYHSIPEYANRR